MSVAVQMQNTTEIGSIFNFHVSQGSVAIHLRYAGNSLLRVHIKFSWESDSESILKIGIHLYPSCGQNSSTVFRDTVVFWTHSVVNFTVTHISLTLSSGPCTVPTTLPS